jgi:hypothetical protein
MHCPQFKETIMSQLSDVTRKAFMPALIDVLFGENRLLKALTKNNNDLR